MEEFAARFGGDAADFAAVKQWAVDNQLSILHESSARTSLTVRGTVAQMESLFNTQLSNYRSATGDEFYSRQRRTNPPERNRVENTRGGGSTSGGVQKAPLYKVRKTLPSAPASRTDSGTGPGGGFAPDDLKTAYSIPTFGGLVKQTVAIFEQAGIVKSDLTTYQTQFGLLPFQSLKPV